MAKTLAQLVTDTRSIIAQTTAANSQITDAQITIWLNDAYRRVSTALRCLPYTPRDYTAAATVTLNAAVVTVDQARIKNPDDGNKYQLLRVVTLDELLRIDSDYENATTGVPEVLAWSTISSGAISITLYPPPKASVIALTTPLRCYGYENPSDMAADADAPNLPANIHDILPNYAAHRCFLQMNDEPRSTQQLILFRSGLKDQKGISTEFSQQSNRFRFSEQADY